MNEIRSECARALSNVELSLDRARRFPRNVFRGHWRCFFFESDRVFEGEFVEQVRLLLEIEGGACACLINLDHEAEAGRDNKFFMGLDTTSDAYRALLGGGSPGEGWIYDMDRFGCTSDLSQWSIYCERNNEIAVLGVRREAPVDRYRPLLLQLSAIHIAAAIEKPLSYGFSAEALSPQWIRELLEEYQS